MKALLVADNLLAIDNISQVLETAGYDVIIYKWLLKALDNVEEIGPHLIVISTKDYPRHWKTLTQFASTDFGGYKPQVILYAEGGLDADENEKAKALKVRGIFESVDVNGLDELRSILSKNVDIYSGKLLDEDGNVVKLPAPEEKQAVVEEIPETAIEEDEVESEIEDEAPFTVESILAENFDDEPSEIQEESDVMTEDSIEETEVEDDFEASIKESDVMTEDSIEESEVTSEEPEVSSEEPVLEDNSVSVQQNEVDELFAAGKVVTEVEETSRPASDFLPEKQVEEEKTFGVDGAIFDTSSNFMDNIEDMFAAAEEEQLAVQEFYSSGSNNITENEVPPEENSENETSAVAELEQKIGESEADADSYMDNIEDAFAAAEEEQQEVSDYYNSNLEDKFAEAEQDQLDASEYYNNNLEDKFAEAEADQLEVNEIYNNSSEPVVQEPVLETVAQKPAENNETVKYCSLMFTNPVSGQLVSGYAHHFNGTTLTFDADIADFVKNLTAGCTITNATLKTEGEFQDVCATVKQNNENLVLELC